MTTYTQEQLLKAVQYACAMQKAECYHIAGNDLLDFGDVLNELYKVDPKNLVKITIEEIDDYLNEQK